MKSPWLAAGVLLLLCACGTRPRTPDWQISAHDALERYTANYLRGDDRAAAAEFARARADLASTGQPGLVARAELTRCALQVASLMTEPCAGFEPLRADAPAAERAYAEYLAGRVVPDQLQLLPPQHRAAAAGQAGAGELAAITDPLSRLVAAGVLLRTGRATPATLVAASDTASAQGWRRPLLAWLGVQALRAEQAGDTAAAQRLRRRIGLVTAQP